MKHSTQRIRNKRYRLNEENTIMTDSTVKAADAYIQDLVGKANAQLDEVYIDAPEFYEDEDSNGFEIELWLASHNPLLDGIGAIIKGEFNPSYTVWTDYDVDSSGKRGFLNSEADMKDFVESAADWAKGVKLLESVASKIEAYFKKLG